MNLLPGKTYKKSNTMLFGSASLLSFVFASLLLTNFEIEATVADNNSQSNTKCYEIKSLDNYWDMFKHDNGFCPVDNLDLELYRFKNTNELFTFLDLSFLNPIVALDTGDENSSDLVSPEHFQKKFSNMKSFSIKIFNDIFPSHSEMKRLVKIENLTRTFKEILSQFSSKLQVDILENIKKSFTKSELAQAIDEIQPNDPINDIFSIYQKKLDELINNDDIPSKRRIDSEYNILHSLLLTLFLEKISEGILQNLPGNLKEIHLSILAYRKPLLSIANSIRNLTELEKIELSGEYFSYESSDYIQFLSSLPKCQNMMLNGQKLSHLFIEFVKQNLTEIVYGSSMQNEASANDMFQSLSSLYLFVDSKKSFTIEDIQSVMKLPVLESLRIRNLPDNFISYDKLKEVANESQLLRFEFCWDSDIFSKSISGKRENSVVPFDCEFDFQILLQSQISELKERIQELPKDQNEGILPCENIMILSTIHKVEYIFDIFRLFEVYFSRNDNIRIKSALSFMRQSITTALTKRKEIINDYFPAKYDFNNKKTTQNEERLRIHEEEMVSNQNDFNTKLRETIKKLNEIISENNNLSGQEDESKAQTLAMIRSKIDNFERIVFD